ncbi:hypothetical protein QFC22_000637 [Naganishia vaughanmartiniae]|uniref:Uncharacterized protein n=1 Tax=Naganishia vaughanmartiniae TaxID=1424756 RepID=A0ACC2XPV6_9TREE|nr:hypothetical protein QFC22_000637 [Naganishia vaughanmartiniae]
MPPDRPHTDKPRLNVYARPESKASAPTTTANSIPHRPPPVPYPTGHSSSSASEIQGADSSSSFAHTPAQPFAYPTPSAETIGTIPLYPLLSRIRIHVVPTKLDDQLPIMYSYVESLGGLTSSIEDCSIAVTVLKGRPRLLKILGQGNIDGKWILSMDWLKDAHERCVQYRTSLLAARNQRRLQAAVGVDDQGELTDQEQAESQPSSTSTAVAQTYVAPPQLAPREAYVIPGTSSHALASASGANDPPVIDDDQDPTQASTYTNSQYPRLPDLEPFPEDIRFEDIPNRAVQRCSPLVCVNQDIIEAIKPIYQMREFEDPTQKNSNVLSYKRSMSIDEFLETGYVAESEEILASDRYQALELFASVFTIGNAIAKQLYDVHGCRTIDDLLEHYALREAAGWDTGVVGQGIPTGYKSKPGGGGERSSTGEPRRRSRDAARRRKEGKMSQPEIVREWIALKPDLDKKIPRAEVTEIAEYVKVHLDALMPGCRCTVTGGYRRGKPESNDVDVVICPPTDEVDETQLLRDLYTRMADLGIVTHILQLTGASHQYAEHNNFDGLDKAFVLFRLPPIPLDDGTGVAHRRLTRRVDFIMSPKSKYALAVLGWSGSMIFERDLKRYAENEKNLKFDSGRLSDRSTRQELFPKTEREIFDIMGLRYVRPQWRNADG